MPTPYSNATHEVTATATSARARMPVFVAAISAVAFLATTGWTSVSWDVTATNVLSWQLATTGDPVFAPSTYPALDQHPLREVWVIERTDGEEVVGRSPGAVLAGVPAYAAVGRGAFSLWPGALTAALLTALAVWLMALTLRELVPRRGAALAALVFALATPVLTVAANGMWPHTITLLGICGMAWAAVRERWLLVGLFGGVVLWGRLHAAVVVAVVGLLVGWHRRDARVTRVVGAGSVLLLALQAGWTRWIYASWNPLSSYETGKFQNYAGGHTFDVVNQLGFWISPDRGILVWTPTILVLLPSLVRHWRGLPDWTTALLLSGIAYTVTQGLLNRFSGGDAFYGYRLTLELLACATPALALAAMRAGRMARALLPFVLAYQALTVLPGAVNDRLGSLADEVWTRNAFFSALFAAPGPAPVSLMSFALICVAGGVLGRRIWAGDSQAAPLDQDGTPRASK